MQIAEKCSDIIQQFKYRIDGIVIVGAAAAATAPLPLLSMLVKLHHKCQTQI